MFSSENFYINGIKNTQLNLYLVSFDSQVLNETGSVFSRGADVDTTNAFNPVVSTSNDDTNEVTLNFALADQNKRALVWTEELITEITNIFTEKPVNEFISEDFPTNIFYMICTKITKKFNYLKQGVLEITFKLASMYSYVRKSFKATCTNSTNLIINNVGVNRYRPIIKVTNKGTTSTTNIIGNIEITGLEANETITIDNMMLLVYSSGVNKYDNTNGAWVVLEKGNNTINISGNCVVEVLCEFPQLV